MRRSAATLVAVRLTFVARPAPAADGKHFGEVKPKTRTGVTVTRAALDERDQVRFTNVAPGCPAACAGVAIDVDSGAGTITVASWSFGATLSGSFAQSR